MTLTLTIDGTDYTDNIDLTDARVEDTATPLNSIMSFTLRDESGVVGEPPIDLRERMEVVLTSASGGREFGGQISALDPVLDGLAIEYRIACQGFDCLLDQRVIEDMTGAPAAPCYDDDLVEWVIGFGSDLGLTADTIRRTRVVAFAKVPDMSGQTLRQAFATIASRTKGARAWVDHSKGVHWNSPKSGDSILNGDFEGAGVWSLDSLATLQPNGGPGGTGDQALRVVGNGSGTHQSTQIVSGIVAGRRYVVSGDLYASVAGAARLMVTWRDGSNTTISSDSIDHTGSNAAWHAESRVLTAPSGTASAVVKLGLASATSTATVKFDDVSMIGETAAFGMSTTPDGDVTRALHDWGEPRDASQPVNRVLVRGKGISGWRNHWGSIGYYGQVFEGVVDDERVTLQSGIDSRAEDIFAKSAFPASSGHYWTEDSGLAAGDFQIIEIEPLGRSTVAWLATITKTFMGDDRIRYAVTYGVPNEDVAALMVGQSAYSAGETHRRVMSEGTIVDRLTDLSIGGANMVTNSSGESTGGWTAGTGWTVGYANDAAWDGNKTFHAASSSLGDLKLTDYIRVDRSDDYWASLWSLLSSVATGASVKVWVDQYDSSDNLLASTAIADVSAVQPAWVRHSAHFGPTADDSGRIAFANLTTRIRLRASKGAAGAVVWDLDAWQFERSRLLTAYAPAPAELLIADGAITETKIADDAVTTPKLVANAVVAGKIAASAVTADALAAHAISADKLAIGTNPGATGLDNPMFQTGDLTGWTFSTNDDASATCVAQQSTGDPPGGWNARIVRSASGSSSYLTSNTFVPVAGGRPVTVGVCARANTNGHNLRMVTIWYDKSKALISTSTTNSPLTNAFAYYTSTNTAPATAAYMKVRISATTASSTIHFTDIRYSLDQSLSGAAGTVVLNESGITVTNGALTVKNAAGTVIIDGSSDMFKILTTGTTSVVASAAVAFNTKTTTTVISALGTFSAPCAHMSFIADGTAVGAAKFGDFDVYTGDPDTNWVRLASTSGGGAPQSWSGVLIIGTILQLASSLNASNQERIQFLCQVGEDWGGAVTYNARYYVLAEAAF